MIVAWVDDFRPLFFIVCGGLRVALSFRKHSRVPRHFAPYLFSPFSLSDIDNGISIFRCYICATTLYVI